MVLTSREAERQWCPFVRDVGQQRGSVNNGQHARCIGDHCMAWRWWAESTPDSGGKPVGYCGIAGTPRQEVYEGFLF